jgi:transcriptional regulator with XRE-family HTH domain
MTKTPSATDRYIGSRIRLRRTLIGMSQEKLGAALGITFQQVQKYEKGVNRVGAGRLQSIGSILNVPVSYFYEGLPDNDALEGKQDNAMTVLLGTPDGVRLVDAFMAVEDGRLQSKIVDIVEMIVQARKMSSQLEKSS